MHKKLLLDAYEKVHSEWVQEYGVVPSQKACGDKLSAIISESYPYSEKSLRTRYNKAKKGERISIGQVEVLDALTVYLGYKNYQEFSNKNSKEEESELKKGRKPENSKAPIPVLTRNKVALLLILIVACALLAYLYMNRIRWMEWQQTHYVEVSFDAKKLNEGNLKLYQQQKIDHLKRMEADCQTVFFNPDGSAKVFYGKNKKGEYQWFTDTGQHPETGKLLKPITTYMIKKYICVQNPQN